MIKKYESFMNDGLYKQKIISNLANLKSFLIVDLGFKKVIDDKLGISGEFEDVNHSYQEPLKYLHSTGKFPEIKNINGEFIHYKMKSVRKRIVDMDGYFHPVNKLNTNYSDIATLLYDIIDGLGRLNEIINLSGESLKKWLRDFINSIDLYEEIDKFDLKEYTTNIQRFSKIGDESENFVRDYIIKSHGFKLLYQGGDGDFVDMIFGVDLIMEYKGRVITIQVKSTSSSAKDSFSDYRYKRVDYICAPVMSGGVRKVIVYSSKNPYGIII